MIAASLALYGSGCSRNSIFESETRIVRLIREVQVEEVRYRSTHGSYGDLAALRGSAANVINEEMASGIVGDYRFQIAVSSFGYVITAWRAPTLDSPYRSFFADETGVIRYSLGPTLATRKSPRIDGQPN